MANAKEDVPVEILPGTQEWKTREFLAREAAEYEARTGQKVTWEPDHPLVSTPLETVPVDRSTMTIKVLKEEAKTLGVDVTNLKKKADIIAAIEAKLSETADSDIDEDPESAGGESE